MRAPETEAIGTAGASEVAAEFQRLGWGAMENARHDLGTDFFLAVRDERRFDLGLIVGAQVKSGPSYFAETKYDDDGELEGWWYRDDDGDHIDAWLSHTLPHLVVLRDMEARVSYWAHVTADGVVSTGKGAKLLVPRSQVVSLDQREALLDVAKTQRPSVPWEGSTWTAGSALTPHQLLRHALVVPRLVAPHPNAGRVGGLTPEQAVAMLMQARLNDLDRFAQEHQDVPALRDADESSDWRWRLARALGDRLTTSRPDALIAVVDDAPSPWTQAAATVAAAAALIELAQPEEALELLNATLDRDDAEPVDRAWLLMQRARASAEIGHLEEARADALCVVGIRNVAPHDATATALAGAAANLLFNTSGWGSRDLEQAITGSIQPRAGGVSRRPRADSTRSSTERSRPGPLIPQRGSAPTTPIISSSLRPCSLAISEARAAGAT
jgi:tetratricopeptide (TPR) repeat protein